MSDVVLAVIRRGDRCFLQRRPAGSAVLPGLWEFPGGKVEAGETLAQALARELSEETGLAPRAFQPLPVLEGATRLHPFLVDAGEDPRTELAWGWFTAEEMARLPIPPANGPLILRLGGLSGPGFPRRSERPQEGAGPF